MALSPSKEKTLAALNSRTEREHVEATETAIRMGRPIPSKPAPLTHEHMEWPKWLHKGWRLSEKGDGHYEAKESKLVNNATEAKALGAGWTEEPPKVTEKPEEPDEPVKPLKK